MNKIFKLLSVLFCVGYTTLGFAQDTLQLGWAGAATPTTLYGPIYRFSATSAVTHARSNMLFTQPELATAALPMGAVITGIQFNKYVFNTFNNPIRLNMYMANTSNLKLSKTTLWNDILASHSIVYSKPNFNISTDSGWQHWDISPFTYTGKSIELACEQVMTGSGGATGLINWRYDPSISTENIIGQTGINTAPDTLNGTNANYLRRPNIRIIYTTTPLPLLFTYFTATKQANKVLLQWGVNKELNTHSYEIERSNNATHFYSIAQLNASGFSKYQTTDYTAIQPTIWYRLKITNKDASIHYSPVIQLNASSANTPFAEAYPNPFKNNIWVKVNLAQQQQVAIQLLTIGGQTMFQTTTQLPKGISTIPINTMQLPKSCYQIKITAGKQQQTQQICN